MCTYFIVGFQKRISTFSLLTSAWPRPPRRCHDLHATVHVHFVKALPTYRVHSTVKSQLCMHYSSSGITYRLLQSSVSAQEMFWMQYTHHQWPRFLSSPFLPSSSDGQLFSRSCRVIGVSYEEATVNLSTARVQIAVVEKNDISAYPGRKSSLVMEGEVCTTQEREMKDSSGFKMSRLCSPKLLFSLLSVDWSLDNTSRRKRKCGRILLEEAPVEKILRKKVPIGLSLVLFPLGLFF